MFAAELREYVFGSAEGYFDDLRPCDYFLAVAFEVAEEGDLQAGMCLPIRFASTWAFASPHAVIFK